jgi:hypothetical protein
MLSRVLVTTLEYVSSFALCRTYTTVPSSYSYDEPYGALCAP